MRLAVCVKMFAAVSRLLNTGPELSARPPTSATSTPAALGTGLDEGCDGMDAFTHTHLTSKLHKLTKKIIIINGGKIYIKNIHIII